MIIHIYNTHIYHAKSVTLIFNYNSTISMLFTPLETKINTPQKSYKIYNFTLAVSP